MATRELREKIRETIQQAYKVAEECSTLRRRLRRRSIPGGSRQAELERAILSTKAAAYPLRSLSGKAQWPQHGISDQDARSIRDAVDALAGERRSLRKMLRPSPIGRPTDRRVLEKRP